MKCPQCTYLFSKSDPKPLYHRSTLCPHCGTPLLRKFPMWRVVLSIVVLVISPIILWLWGEMMVLYTTLGLLLALMFLEWKPKVKVDHSYGKNPSQKIILLILVSLSSLVFFFINDAREFLSRIYCT